MEIGNYIIDETKIIGIGPILGDIKRDQFNTEINYYFMLLLETYSFKIETGFMSAVKMGDTVIDSKSKEKEFRKSWATLHSFLSKRLNQI